MQEQDLGLSNFLVVGDGVVALDELKKNRFNCLLPRKRNLLSSLALSYYNVEESG